MPRNRGHGLPLIRRISRRKVGAPVNVLTHCNAGWLAFVDHGSATAPIYAAHDAGIAVHVWVDETRPRSQGAKLTAWELGQHGVPHTIIADNTGGHLMQRDMVDLVITGTDRTTRTGDVANKIGTYLKALAARDNRIPFYVALPSSSFDWKMRDGLREIPIEERGSEEVKFADGLLVGANGRAGRHAEVLIAPPESPRRTTASTSRPRVSSPASSPSADSAARMKNPSSRFSPSTPFADDGHWLGPRLAWCAPLVLRGSAHYEVRDVPLKLST